MNPDIAQLLADARAASEREVFDQWVRTSTSFACNDCGADVTFADMSVEFVQTEPQVTVIYFYCRTCAPNHPGATDQD